MGRTEYTLSAVNQRLKQAKVRVSVKQRGDKLSLVATLPPKPGSNRFQPYQQLIALGLPANENGFKIAEQEAQLLGSRIVLRQFDWKQYLGEGNGDQDIAMNLIQQFKAEYLSTHTLTEATWLNHWWKIYKRLPQDQALDPAKLLDLVLATEANTRNRKQTCQKLQKLADFAGVKVNLLKYQGNYGNNKVHDRDIPTDAAIAHWCNQIRSLEWRWVYGMMAAFGLRDHEVFFCEFEPEGLRVSEGKTGPRLVFAALYPEWVEQWQLQDMKRPEIRLDKGYDYLSDRTGKAFRRYSVPFKPYDLCHAYAIRASVNFGYPTPTAAALMGHSPEIHLKTYQRHISQKQHLETSQRILSQSNRPKPPDDSRDLI
jgi:integrase